MLRTLAVFVCLCCSGLWAGETIRVEPASVALGQSIQVLVVNDPCPDHECAMLLYDSFARLVGIRTIPAGESQPPEPSPELAGVEFKPVGQYWFATSGLAPGAYTVKMARRDGTADDGPYTVLAEAAVTVRSAPGIHGPVAAPADKLTLWRPAKPLLFWRNLPLAVDHKDDWEKLLKDTALSGPLAPFDGPTLVLPMGAQPSLALIQSDINPVLRQRGLVICETWPVPLTRDDMLGVEALTGLIGPAVDAEAAPADWDQKESHNRLLARRDPESRRLYGLTEKSFACLTRGLKLYPTTDVLRWAADGTPAITIRLFPRGGAVVVLNAQVTGYSALAAAPVQDADWLGATEADAEAALRGQSGGVALRAALKQVHDLLDARRKLVGEDLPLWEMKTVLRQGHDRTFYMDVKLAPTARTLPGMVPPAAVSLWLTHAAKAGEDGGAPTRQYWEIPLVDLQGTQAFRIPLDDDGEQAWSVQIENPFTGNRQSITIPLEAPTVIELHDRAELPAEPAAAVPTPAVAPAIAPAAPAAPNAPAENPRPAPAAPAFVPTPAPAPKPAPAAPPAAAPAPAPAPSKTKID